MRINLTYTMCLRPYSLAVLFIIAFLPFNGKSQNNFAIIPKLTSLQVQEGVYRFSADAQVQVSPEFKEVAGLLTEHPAIRKVTISHTPGIGKIAIIKATSKDNLRKTAYSVSIRSNGITLKAWGREQALSAVYTLIQLGYLQNDPAQIGAADITDEPRFSYRGLHLDVSRHFMPLTFIRKYIDLMALYKFNTLHWHITDGAGWRLAIKKYPELTQKAAWRTHITWKDWWNNGRQYVDRGSPNASGGFYTQDEARELVTYAARRGINIIPEIEMPGHSEEVIAIYPYLSCTGKPYTQSEFCIGNPETFVFLKNVLDEVLAIFPSPYIHIGGDEADKKHWKDCPKDQALMQREGLNSVEELQSYAIRQMDLYLQSKGRKLIGWDEILEGGLTAGATVMSWRGEEGGIKSANAGHDVIMTPGSHLYFDAYQTDPRTQPEAIGGYLPLEKVYGYDPVPEAIAADKKHHILGAQANIWTEYISTTEHVEYMVFPRALALSEVNWTLPEDKSWPDFQNRLQSHYKLLQDLHVNYYRPSYNVTYSAVYDTGLRKNRVTLSTEQLNSQNIRYTLDGTPPQLTSAPYTGPLLLSKSTRVSARYFQDSIPIGPLLTFDTDIHKAIGKPVIYNSPWDGYAAQKENTMTNGIQGGLTYHDGQWQGFTRPIDLIVDLQEIQSIHTVAMNFMQMIGPGVYMPGKLEVFISEDGKNFKAIGNVPNDIPDQDPKLTFKRSQLNLDTPVQARFIQVKASNPKRGYLFTDEIIIY
ncbi:MAG: family 20 glycosylhydrolase [Leadbetterella sp.]|nr:family 20 glycosylhydrolase [Leadbetterella sp.]